MRAYRRAVMHASPVAGFIVRTAVIRQWSIMRRVLKWRGRRAIRLFAAGLRIQVNGVTV
jgi:hypothetical protein